MTTHRLLLPLTAWRRLRAAEPRTPRSARPRTRPSDETQELLRPTADEPAAERARRQARAYLDRRRQRLSADLDARGEEHERGR